MKARGPLSNLLTSSKRWKNTNLRIHRLNINNNKTKTRHHSQVSVRKFQKLQIGLKLKIEIFKNT